MPGTTQLLRQQAIAGGTATQTLTNPTGPVSGAATFLVNVTNIGSGDTWSIELSGYVGKITQRIVIGSKTGITAVGLYRIPLSADFNAVKMAVFRPTHSTHTLDVDGGGPATITYDIYGIFAD